MRIFGGVIKHHLKTMIDTYVQENGIWNFKRLKSLLKPPHFMIGSLLESYFADNSMLARKVSF